MLHKPMDIIKPIYLIGYRCTGKSTTGKLLANLMDCPFFDTDRIIEEQFETSIEKMINLHATTSVKKKFLN